MHFCFFIFENVTIFSSSNPQFFLVSNLINTDVVIYRISTKLSLTCVRVRTKERNEKYTTFHQSVFIMRENETCRSFQTRQVLISSTFNINHIRVKY